MTKAQGKGLGCISVDGGKAQGHAGCGDSCEREENGSSFHVGLPEMKLDERDGPQRPGCEMFSNLHAIFWMHFSVSFHRNKAEFSRNSVSKETRMADISLIDYNYCFLVAFLPP